MTAPTSASRVKTASLAQHDNAAHGKLRVEPPQDPRIPPSQPQPLADELIQELRRRFATEASEREEWVANHFEKPGHDITHADAAVVTPAHAQQALESLFGPKALLYMPPPIRCEKSWFKKVDKLYSLQFRDFEAPAISLRAEGRRALATYYARKYGADIVFPITEGKSFDQFMAGVLSEDREEHPDEPRPDIRRAYYFDEDSHATLMVHIRENGREAMFAFDSMADGTMPAGKALSAGIDWHEALTTLNGGNAIPIYELTQPLQIDHESCWAFAMKAAVTLTGHRPDGAGGLAGHFIPGLIEELDSLRLDTKVTSSVIPVWAPVDLAKMSQTWTGAAAHAGQRFNQPFRFSKHGDALPTFLAKHSMPTAARKGGSRPAWEEVVIFDYMRAKGARFAEIIQIEMWIRQIGWHLRTRAAKGLAWGVSEQNKFAEHVKKAVRAAPAPDPFNDRIRNLRGEYFLADASQLLKEIVVNTVDVRAYLRAAIRRSEADWRELQATLADTERKLETLARRIGQSGAYVAERQALDRSGPLHALLEEVTGALDDSEGWSSVVAKRAGVAPAEERLRRAMAEIADKQGACDLISKIGKVAHAGHDPANALAAIESAAGEALRAINAAMIRVPTPDDQDSWIEGLSGDKLMDARQDLEMTRLLLHDWKMQCSEAGAVLHPAAPEDEEDGVTDDEDGDIRSGNAAVDTWLDGVRDSRNDRTGDIEQTLELIDIEIGKRVAAQAYVDLDDLLTVTAEVEEIEVITPSRVTP